MHRPDATDNTSNDDMYNQYVLMIISNIRANIICVHTCNSN